MERRKNNNLSVSGVISLSLVFVIALVYSCKHEPYETSDFPEICFEKEVLPIFQNSCGLSGCHDESTAKEGYVLTNYNSILKAIMPGEPEKSPAYTSLTARGEDRMPPDNVLPLQSRQTIRLWIEQGAQNTTCTDTGNNGGNNGNGGVGRACFERDILPVLLSSCGISGCHDNITKADGYSLTDYNGTLAAVIPGDPQESELFEKITEDSPSDRMPPPGYDPLPQQHIDSIYNWILYGALNEDCGESCDTISEITFSAVVWPILELNCRGCHSGNNPSGSVYLTDYSTVSFVASSGLLNSVLRGTNEKPIMPPSGSLPECNIRQIELWIENGYQNN
jgi:hypothetical protein